MHFRPIAIAAILAACTAAEEVEETIPFEVGDLMPDFALVDENPNSATWGESVSTSDHRNRPSAWYFLHST